jgi:hypothetical protein
LLRLRDGQSGALSFDHHHVGVRTVEDPAARLATVITTIGTDQHGRESHRRSHFARARRTDEQVGMDRLDRRRS